MNNLNDPPRWNIDPDQGEQRAGGRAAGGNGSPWNYALLIHMLGWAAFSWIWTRKSQREINEVKVRHNDEVSSLRTKMEKKYRQSLTELQKQVETEKQRVEGYENIMQSYKLQMMEDNKQLKQALKELESSLVERQHAYCSTLRPRAQRMNMEQGILLKAAKVDLGRGVDLDRDLKDIFRKDKHCAVMWNTDGRKNGSLMWVYLKHWQQQVTVETQKRAHEALLRGEIGSRVE